MLKTHKVVAAIIKNQNREILFAQRRSTDKYLPYFWEFPGGKINKEETPIEALTREIYEELELNIKIESKFMDNVHIYPFARIELKSYLATCSQNEFKKNEHENVLWLKKKRRKI